MRKVLLLSIIALNISFAPSAWGASCAVSALDQFDHFQSSPIVFRAKVLSTRDRDPSPDGWGYPFGGAWVTEVQVTKVYKGSPKPKFTLYTDQLEPGREYVFFPEYSDSAQKYIVTWCGELAYPVDSDDTANAGQLDQQVSSRFLLRELEQIVSKKIEGQLTTYYANGNPKVERHFRNDTFSHMMGKEPELDGVLKTYYENGSIRTEETYIRGQKDGLYRWYYPSGALMDEFYYVDGKIDGVYRRYNEDGSLNRETLYRAGERVQ